MLLTFLQEFQVTFGKASFVEMLNKILHHVRVLSLRSAIFIALSVFSWPHTAHIL